MQFLILGLVAGCFSGLLGVGGGIIIVPALTLLTNMPIKMAVGTSLAVIIPTALSGVSNHFRLGNVDLKAGMLVAAGAVVGALVGSWLTTVLPDLMIKRLFAVLMVVVAVRMFLGK